MKSPDFLSYHQRDHEAARATKYVGDLIDWLRWEADNALAEVGAFVRQNRPHEAAMSAGRMEAFTSVVESLYRSDEATEAQEPEFIDPNMPSRARGT